MPKAQNSSFPKKARLVQTLLDAASPPAPLVPVAVLLVAGVVPALLPPHHLLGAGLPALAGSHENVAIALLTHAWMDPVTMAK